MLIPQPSNSNPFLLQLQTSYSTLPLQQYGNSRLFEISKPNKTVA